MGCNHHSDLLLYVLKLLIKEKNYCVSHKVGVHSMRWMWEPFCLKMEVVSVSSITLVQTGCVTSLEADSFLKASHIARTRRANQVTACVLHQALEKAHQEHVKSTESNTEPMSMEDWHTHRSAGNSTGVQVLVPFPADPALFSKIRSNVINNFPPIVQSSSRQPHRYLHVQALHSDDYKYNFFNSTIGTWNKSSLIISKHYSFQDNNTQLDNSSFLEKDKQHMDTQVINKCTCVE